MEADNLDHKKKLKKVTRERSDVMVVTPPEEGRVEKDEKTERKLPRFDLLWQRDPALVARLEELTPTAEEERKAEAELKRERRNKKNLEHQGR